MVPEFVDRTRGSQWNRALPGRRQNPRQPESAKPTNDFRNVTGNPQTSAASTYGGRWSSIGYAVATGTGPCPAAVGPADR